MYGLHGIYPVLAFLADVGKVDTDLLLTTAVYDIYKSTGEGHQTCGFWAVIRAIIGYTHNPSMLWWIVYLVYWAAVLSILGYRYWTGTLFSKFGNNPFEEEDAEITGKGNGSDTSSDIERGAVPAMIPPVPPQMSWVQAAPGMPTGGSPPAASMPGAMIPMVLYASPVSEPMQGIASLHAELVQGVNFGGNGAGFGCPQPPPFRAYN